MRPNWDEYFLLIASQVALRSTCNRKQVGCVLVRDNRILATGYGGSIRGQPHCVDVGCDIDPNTKGCKRTVHAEINAILQCAKHGVSTDGAVAYVTLSPCADCFKALANAGISKVVYAEEYRVPPNAELAASCGMLLVHKP
jgi:dCMP deaminase